MPAIGPHNPALGEIYQRLYPEMRRPKPNQEAIAAALQAMQRLTMESDSETVAEDATPGTRFRPSPCLPRLWTSQSRRQQVLRQCAAFPWEPRHLSRQIPIARLRRTHARLRRRASAPKFATSTRTPEPGMKCTRRPALPPARITTTITTITTISRADTTLPPPRPNAPESAREADRIRIAAAAKGEPMSRSEAAVRRLTQEWVLACNTRQLDELMELYAPDALVLRSNLPPIRGAVAVREFFFASLEAGLGEVSVEPMRVEVLGDLAHEVGRYSALVPGTAGKRREERGKYLWVFAKQASGDWKLVSECWSTDLTLSGSESDVPKSAIPSAKPQPRRS